MADKTCPKCGRSGPIDVMFGMRNMRRTLKDGRSVVKSGPQSYCRDCRSGRSKQLTMSPRKEDAGCRGSEVGPRTATTTVPSGSPPEVIAPFASIGAATDLGTRLPAIPIPGLSPDSLGNYLASLGLLRVLCRKWPSTRVAWRDDLLQVVGGPTTLDELLDELMDVANAPTKWTAYDKAWTSKQKEATKAKSGVALAHWQAEADEDILEMFVAHAVPHARVSFNPLLGSGGNAGARDFAKGWHCSVNTLSAAIKALDTAKETHRKALTDASKAHDNARAKGDEKHKAALAKANNVQAEAARARRIANVEDVRTTAYAKADKKHQAAAKKADDKFHNVACPRREFKNLLRGQPNDWIVDGLAAGSWFADATKLYNSGQKPARDSQASPWAMALACEGLVFFAGGASRRLGARTQAIGAFPFVTWSAAATAENEADRVDAEIWAPLWARPMSQPEVRALFQRGRAELASRGALTPAAFATAIHKRGVDAGIEKFHRFTLGRTTSGNTFEPRLMGRFLRAANDSTSRVLERVTALIEHRGFPRDGTRFTGLRGPIESTLLDLAAAPNRAEAGIALLDAVVSALDRIDRNRSYREQGVQWEPLPIEWLPSLFTHDAPTAEARLALALVSGFPKALPFTAFRFGVSWTKGGMVDGHTFPRRFEHSKVAPARWVWGPGEVARVLGSVLTRKLLEEPKLNVPGKPWRGCAPLPAPAAHLRRWLSGDLDEPLLVAWLSRLALFDWRRAPPNARALAVPTAARSANGELALIGLVQPLVDRRRLVVKVLSPDDLLDEERGARTPEAARTLVGLLRAGDIGAVLRLTASRYAMAGARLATFDATWRTQNPDRLVAALLFPLSDPERSALFERWLRPRRRP